MKQFRVKNIRLIWAALGILLVAASPHVSAQYTSPSYKAEEVFFGSGGELESTSPSFKAQSSVGSLGVGSGSSPNFDANAGFLTAGEPFLEMEVTGATVSFGTLTDTSTASGAAQAGTCNCSFTVRTYLSSEYTVKTVSQPPTNENGDVLDAKTVLGAPSTDQNVEEFGINLVDNSSPDIGAGASNDPDSTFADGVAATGYATPNQFKYVVGETIARSAASAGNAATGKTNYTISYIAKRNPMTPAGYYVMNHDLVVVPVF